MEISSSNYVVVSLDLSLQMVTPKDNLFLTVLRLYIFEWKKGVHVHIFGKHFDNN